MSYSQVLRIPAFRNLWLGQAISQLGDAFYYVVFMFMVTKLTGSNHMVGYVGALEALPYLLFGPYAGVVADRFDRRKIMLLSDVVSGGVLLLFAAIMLFNAQPPVWSLMVTAFALSSIRVFFIPAKSAAIPNVVPESSVLTANALSMATQNIMPMLGLALSAGVLGVVYELNPKAFYTITIGINSLSFLLSAVFIWKLPKLIPERTDAAPAKPLADFKEGIRYIRGRHDLTVLISLLTVFRLFVSPFFVVYMATNEVWFDGKPATVAWIECAFFAGMVIASGFVGRLNPQRPAMWFCFGLAIVGATVGAMAFSPFIGMFVLLNLIAGFALPPADIPLNTYMQLSVPDQFRGRANSVLNMVATGAMPIGAVMGGFLVDSLGVSGTYLVMGVGMMAACLWGLVDQEFRNVRMPKPEPAPEPVEPKEPERELVGTA